MARTGGPLDVIVDADENPENGNGLLFEPTIEGWRSGLARALALHAETVRCGEVRNRGLLLDSSWKKLTPPYVQLYREMA
jgi:glycogen synthase